MSDIKNRVREYIMDDFLMGGVADELTDEASFMDRHILDSTGFIELISFLEQSFGIKVRDEEMVPENLDSLQNIECYVQRKRAAYGWRTEESSGNTVT
ncbi:MAG: acyl carrier protein [bacterium]